MKKATIQAGVICVERLYLGFFLCPISSVRNVESIKLNDPRCDDCAELRMPPYLPGVPVGLAECTTFAILGGLEPN